MSDMHLGVVESNFADLIWANEPISTQELTRLCELEAHHHLYGAEASVRAGLVPQRGGTGEFLGEP